MITWSVVLIIAAFVVAWWLTRYLVSHGRWQRLLDHPNERSLHSRPTPRGGGIAILFAMLSFGALGCVLLPFNAVVVFIGIATLIVAAVSFIDDLSHVHPVGRILVHVLVAGILIYAGLSLSAVVLPGVEWQLPGWLASIVTILLVVWLINLYNFMDGMDGFAGGMAMIGFTAFALLGALSGATLFATLAGIIAVAAAGFLVLNFPPARIFMGDVGSSTLGLLVAALSLWADAAGIFPLWIAGLVFSPFIVDATFTLIRRLVSGDRVWQAHKTHCYQRLVQLGWGHRKTVLWEYLLMVLCAVSAIVAALVTPTLQWWVLVSWIVIYAILIASVYRLELRKLPHENFQSL